MVKTDLCFACHNVLIISNLVVLWSLITSILLLVLSIVYGVILREFTHYVSV